MIGGVCMILKVKACEVLGMVLMMICKQLTVYEDFQKTQGMGGSCYH